MPEKRTHAVHNVQTHKKIIMWQRLCNRLQAG